MAAVLCITAAADGQQQYSNRQLLMLSGTGGKVLDAGFFASGAKVGRIVNVVAIEFLNPTTGQRERRVLWPRGEDNVHSRGVASAQLSADGRRIVTGSYDGTARVWRVHTGELLAELNAVEKKSRPWGVIEVAFSADGERVVVGFGDGEVWLWRPDTGDPVVKLLGHGGRITSLSFSPDGMRVVTGSADGTARVWRTETGRLLSTLKPPIRPEFEGTSRGAVTSVAFDPDGKRILTGSGDGKARLWQADTGSLIGERVVHELSIQLYLVAFSPDGRFGLAQSRRRWGPAQRWHLELWHLDTGEPAEILEELRYPISTAAFSRDGEHMLIGDRNGSVFIMDSGNVASRKAVGTTAGRVLHTRFVERYVRAAWVSFVPAVEFVDTDTGARKHVFLWKEPGQDPDVGAVRHGQFSANGTFVVTRHWGGIARVWRAETGEQIAELKGHTDELTSVAISPDGRLIATGSRDHTARLWRPETGELVAELTGHEKTVNSVAFSPDGKYVVTGSMDSTARVWHAPSGALVGELRTPTERDDRRVLALRPRMPPSSARAGTERNLGGGVLDARFSANGELIAVYSGALWIWRAPRWQRPTSNTPSAILKNSSGSFALGPAGRRVTTWVMNGGLRIWDLDRCSETVCPDDAAMVLMTGSWPVHTTFSADGRYLLTWGHQEAPKLWSTSNGLLLTQFVGHQGAIGSASFDAGGRRVLTTGVDGTVRLWEFSPG